MDLQFRHQAVEGMSVDIDRNTSQYNYNVAQFGRRIRDSCRNLKGRHCQNNKSAGAATLAHNPEDYTSLQLPNVSTAMMMMMMMMIMMMIRRAPGPKCTWRWTSPGGRAAVSWTTRGTCAAATRRAPRLKTDMFPSGEHPLHISIE